MNPNHEWIRRARIFLMDNYHPPFWPDLAFDAKKLMEVVREHHANAVRFGSAGKWAVFPNAFWPAHPQLNGRNLVEEVLDEAHAQGVRVIVYAPLGHILPDDNILQHHPEWLHHPAPNSQAQGRPHHGGGSHRQICFNTPYRDAIVGFVKQLVTDHDIDGFYTDSATPYHSHPTPRSCLCYCDHCCENFKRQFGRPMPYAPDPRSLPVAEQEILEQWSLAYGQIVADVLIGLINWIRKTRNIPVLTHGTAVERWPERRVMDVHDGFLYEAGGDFLHRLETASLGESSGHAIWQYVGSLTPWSRLQFFSRELVEEAVASFACGGAINLACGVNFVLDRSGSIHPDLQDLFATLEANEPLFEELHPTRFAAVPFVLPARVYHMLDRLRFRVEPLDIRDRPADVIDGLQVPNPSQRKCIKGAFSSILANNLPVHLIEERHLSDPEMLRRYPLLFLPNIGHLTPEEVRAVANYVERGGRLLATYRTSLYGPQPDKLRDNFALSELLGVDRIACEPDRLKDHHRHFCHSGTFDVYGRSVYGQWLAQNSPHEIWPINRFELVKPRPGTDVVANIVWGGREEELLWPAVTCREFGDGRVVYLAAPIEELHFEFRMPIVRDLLGGIVDWLCPEGRPLVMDGPDQLLAIPNEKPGVQVLFLINHTGERVEGLPELWPRIGRQFNYVPAVPEVNLRWRSAEPGTPRRVWNVYTGTDLAVTLDGRYLKTRLENVGQYGIIAAEF
jgi:hypothetical protein